MTITIASIALAVTAMFGGSADISPQDTVASSTSGIGDIPSDTYISISGGIGILPA